VRFKFSFFKVRRIVSLLILGSISRVILFVRLLTVHLAYPSGGLPHAVAIMWASISPVTIGFLFGSLGVLNCRVVCSPCVWCCFRVLYIVGGVTPMRCAIVICVCGLPAFVSRASSIWARFLNVGAVVLSLTIFCTNSDHVSK
jgi:hypothetical protein